MGMPRAVVALLLGLGLTAPACKQDAAASGPPAESRTADGKRRLAVSVTHGGYKPSKLSARAGEQLVLSFTRSEDFECGRYVKVPGAKEQIELPVGKPVDVALTMPQTGELVFTCGMDMFKGVVAVVPAK